MAMTPFPGDAAVQESGAGVMACVSCRLDPEDSALPEFWGLWIPLLSAMALHPTAEILMGTECMALENFADDPASSFAVGEMDVWRAIKKAMRSFPHSIDVQCSRCHAPSNLTWETLQNKEWVGRGKDVG